MDLSAGSLFSIQFVSSNQKTFPCLQREVSPSSSYPKKWNLCKTYWEAVCETKRTLVIPLLSSEHPWSEKATPVTGQRVKKPVVASTTWKARPHVLLADPKLLTGLTGPWLWHILDTNRGHECPEKKKISITEHNWTILTEKKAEKHVDVCWSRGGESTVSGMPFWWQRPQLNFAD